jgi:RHS repeat-associated protein
MLNRRRANTPIPNVTIMTGYFYDGVPVDRSSSTGRDAMGTRVAKGSLTSFSCNFASNGFKPTTSYVLGAGGEQLTELAVSGAPGNYTSAWTHTNAFSGGHITATYAWSNSAHTATDTYFYLADWLGTKRAEVGAGGCLSTFASLPYGDGLTPSGNCPDATEHHFTGKERDTESGNDYFGARYYSSTVGRFMTPDWSLKAEPVPFARLDIPQTLNLYAYVGNNPLTHTDVDGHAANGNDDSIRDPQADQLSQEEEQRRKAEAKAKNEARQLAWSSLSGAQQNLVYGGEKGWSAMSAKAQDNFAAITHVLEGIKLSEGATGLSQVQSASMRENGQEMDVVWKPGAADAFKSTGKFSETYSLPTHDGAQVLRKGFGSLGQGLELIFPTPDKSESQAHIDYNPLLGFRSGHRHFDTDNDDVTQHMDVYKKFYGSLPGLIP